MEMFKNTAMVSVNYLIPILVCTEKPFIAFLLRLRFLFFIDWIAISAHIHFFSNLLLFPFSVLLFFFPSIFLVQQEPEDSGELYSQVVTSPSKKYFLVVFISVIDV